MKQITRRIALPYGRLVEAALRWRKTPGVARRDPVVLVLAMHRVLPRNSEWLRPSLVVSTGTFEHLLGEISSAFRVVTLEDLVAFFTGEGGPEGDAVLLTFDDGYRDLYDHALPALTSKGIRASFFLTTGFLDGTLPLWWDLLLVLAKEGFTEPVRRALRRLLELGANGGARLTDDPMRLDDVNRVIRLVPALGWRERKAFLENVLASFRGNGRAEWVREQLPPALEWAHVHRMLQLGHSIGAHGVSHLEFVGCSPEEVEAEVRGSVARIREELGRQPVAFAYPGGFTLPEPEGLLGSVGIRVAFTTQPGWVRRSDHPLRLRRVNLCEEVLVDERGTFRRELFYAAVGGLFEKGNGLRRRAIAWLRRLGWQ